MRIIKETELARIERVIERSPRPENESPKRRELYLNYILERFRLTCKHLFKSSFNRL